MRFCKIFIEKASSKNEDVNLKTCADRYGSLADQLCTSRDEFERYEAATKEMLPDIDCKG